MLDYKPFDRHEVIPIDVWRSFEFKEVVIRTWNERIGTMERVFSGPDQVTSIPTKLPYTSEGMPHGLIKVDGIFLDILKSRNMIRRF